MYLMSCILLLIFSQDGGSFCVSVPNRLLGSCSVGTRVCVQIMEIKKFPYGEGKPMLQQAFMS